MSSLVIPVTLSGLVRGIVGIPLICGMIPFFTHSLITSSLVRIHRLTVILAGDVLFKHRQRCGVLLCSRFFRQSLPIDSATAATGSQQPARRHKTQKSVGVNVNIVDIERPLWHTACQGDLMLFVAPQTVLSILLSP